MYHFLYTIEIILIVNIVEIVLTKCADFKNEYVSLVSESEELTDINEVVDSQSKEDNDIYEKAQNSKIIIVTYAPVDSQNRLITSSPLSLENITSKSFNCQEKTSEDSSEENRCKSTLVNYPYSASIQKKGAHYASAALINGQSVLTAAGVFYYVRESIKLFRVRLGSVDCKRDGVVLPIKRVEIHSSYRHGKPAFDLALIKLARPVHLTDTIKPISLSSIRSGVISAKFLTTYWPRLIDNGNVLPKSAKERIKPHNMRVSTQKLIPWKTCAAMMKARDVSLDEASLCLKPIVTHHSVCMPDVGAPVVADDGLWGVTSGWTSQYCTTYPSPTVVTRTAMPSVRAWLESVL